jgi:hypothetical protein
MPLVRIVPLRVVAAALGAGGSVLAQAMGIGPDCLETLSADTRVWSECTAGFDRRDSRCKAYAGRMQATMSRCEAEGASRAEINAAMAAGNAAAGSRLPEGAETPEVEQKPQPRPKRGPIPGFEAPAEGD